MGWDSSGEVTGKLEPTDAEPNSCRWASCSSHRNPNQSLNNDQLLILVLISVRLPLLAPKCDVTSEPMRNQNHFYVTFSAAVSTVLCSWDEIRLYPSYGTESSPSRSLRNRLNGSTASDDVTCSGGNLSIF
ncbi:hypothetical protein GOODEAATRI_019289 [Goodea atripinnis]|uniref:Uncharacterized protein n=1 Tax=Goodea atripinnis TaxID=208336 RepID=A0ABV0MJ34_9TELE